MILGAHESIAGGMHLAFERARSHGCDAFQIFVKNARGWAARPIGEDEVTAFKAEGKKKGGPVAAMAHASYLVNLAAEPGPLREKSIASMVDELSRCARLGIPGLVVHPGAHDDRTKGLPLVAQALDEILAQVPGKSQIWLENTAGQGTALCSRFEEIGVLLDIVKSSRRLGVCFDTCHAWAAGYDLTTPAGYKATMADLTAATGGAEAIRGFHLNDCKKPLGCRVDRHEEIGQGEMGLSPFRFLLQDARFEAVPGVLETPDSERYAEGLKRLRKLV